MLNKIKIRELSNEEIVQIEPLINNSAYGPYRYIKNNGIEKFIHQFWLNRIIMTCSNQTIVFAAESNNGIVGFIIVTHLAWDSKFFKIPMASISDFVVDSNSPNTREIAQTLLKHSIDWAKDSGYGFISCKTYSNDFVNIHSLELSGFLLVDSHLDFVFDYTKTPFVQIPEKKHSPEINVRFARLDDEQELVSLTKSSFENFLGRFHSDPMFSKEQATQLYMEWISSSLKEKENKFILAEIDKRIAGVSVWKQTTNLEKVIPINISHYTIGAIHPDFYGKKLFQLLTYEGMKLFDGKTDLIEGPTNINNFPVQQGYKRLEWQILDAHHSFHLWLNDERRN
jgi:hypothetical protein